MIVSAGIFAMHNSNSKCPQISSYDWRIWVKGACMDKYGKAVVGEGNLAVQNIKHPSFLHSSWY